MGVRSAPPQAVVLPALGQKYPRGDFSLPGNRKLMVSAGIGCVGMPVRLNCRPKSSSSISPDRGGGAVR